MKLLIVLPILLLTACTSLDGKYKEQHELLVRIEKADAKMEAGLAEQAAGAALVTKGKLTYQEGKKAKDEAVAELNELL